MQTGDKMQLLAAQLQTELEKLDLWTNGNLNRPKDLGAFGSPTLSFEQWLQVVLVPALASGESEQMPKKSQLAIAAIRNLDGVPNAEHLIQLLSQIDQLAEKEGRA